MKLMIAVELGSTGALEISWFHKLSAGNGTNPLRLELWPRLIPAQLPGEGFPLVPPPLPPEGGLFEPEPEEEPEELEEEDDEVFVAPEHPASARTAHTTSHRTG
jgi:hypothetical protein